jgi:hypothetical protein
MTRRSPRSSRGSLTSIRPFDGLMVVPCNATYVPQPVVRNTAPTLCLHVVPPACQITSMI